MNPVITAPDSFEVIDLAAGSNMNNVQRRNLGSIAKILQHAASFKIFDSDARYILIEVRNSDYFHWTKNIYH